MRIFASIFLDFNLPNATTWFYFSFLLAVAIFFKFSRFFSIRNTDVVMIFLLVPGLLLLLEARQPVPAPQPPPVSETTVAALVGNSGVQAMTAPVSGSGPLATVAFEPPPPHRPSYLWVGYLWLLIVSGFFVFRCFLDLILVQRPALQPNLNSGGMVWLAIALFACLSAVAYRPPTSSSFTAPPPTLAEDGGDSVGLSTAPLKLAQTPFEPSYWLLRSFSMLCHVSIIVGLILIGAIHFQNFASGMATATCYLLLPYTGYFVGQAHHVWPMALMIWAIFCYRWPMLAGLFMGLAAGTMFFPVLLLPLWISFYWRRGAGRFALTAVVTAVVCLGVTGLVLWLNNTLEQTLNETMALADWQPWMVPIHEGIWTNVHWAYRMPVFIVYVTLVLVTTCWPHPKNLAHLLALSTAVLIGIQFWYADQGGVYVLWYLPFYLLMIFRPNLSGRRPPVIQSDSDWLTRLLDWIKRSVGRWFRGPNKTLLKSTGPK
jgi:hypothetical protein